MKSLILHNLLAGPGVKDTSADSNLWHVRNYEAVADRVYVVFLANRIKGKNVLRNGRTVIIAAGSGSLWKDIFLSPFRLSRLVRRLHPDLTVSYEQVFLWWTLRWVRWFTRTRNWMIPIALPDKIYEITGRSLSGKLPIWFEKTLRRWSMRSVTSIITTKSLGDYKKWLLSDKVASRKTMVLDKLPEEAPSLNFLSHLQDKRTYADASSPNVNLVLIGRLRPEKLTDHAILALAELAAKDRRYRLYIIGEGEEKENLKKLAAEKGVGNLVFFEGYRNTSQIIEFYKGMHVFVSPYTGGALREAALLKLPIVAYNTDWIRDELVPDLEYAAAEFLNYRDLAGKIERIIEDPGYRDRLVNHMFVKAQERWTLQGVKEVFENVLCESGKKAV